ncbi:MAG TPA: putative quinol monooxygenase [Bryobacteraceae bacterium]|jgi:quinol monooxygenase YgiN|nr:putative quinol monooxygenase [Bryobacteraceae bacterium]
MSKLDNDHVILNVHMQAAPGFEAELAEHLSSMVGPTRNEPGCITYQLHRDPEDPSKFMFYERFESQAALDEHGETPHLRRFREYRAKFPERIASTIVTKWRAFA